MATATATTAPPPTAAPADHDDETRLAYLARQASPCLLTPKAFFVSWQGVITLAYEGFPPQLAQLKAALTDAHGNDGALPKESPGSRWPKSSIGCVRDGKRLTPEQLELLLRACKEESAALFGGGGDDAGASAAAASSAPATATSSPLQVAVRNLSVLTYECRSLERVIARQRMPLLAGGGGAAGGINSSTKGAEVDSSPPSEEERGRVDSVLAESDAPDYWVHASRDGGREAHYRGVAPGVTLVHELGLVGGGGGGGGASGGADNAADAEARLRLLEAVRRFRARVDRDLPGVYAWFGDASLHVTVRAIIV
jgi:hypothetical protein